MGSRPETHGNNHLGQWLPTGGKAPRVLIGLALTVCVGLLVCGWRTGPKWPTQSKR